MRFGSGAVLCEYHVANEAGVRSLRLAADDVLCPCGRVGCQLPQSELFGLIGSGRASRAERAARQQQRRWLQAVLSEHTIVVHEAVAQVTRDAGPLDVACRGPTL